MLLFLFLMLEMGSAHIGFIFNNVNKENIFDFIFFNSEKHKKKTLNSNNNNTLKKISKLCYICF